MTSELPVDADDQSLPEQLVRVVTDGKFHSSRAGAPELNEPSTDR